MKNWQWNLIPWYFITVRASDVRVCGRDGVENVFAVPCRSSTAAPDPGGTTKWPRGENTTGRHLQDIAHLNVMLRC